MSLTAHFDARDTDNIFTTFGNPPSGTPSDGSAIEEWMAESGDLAASYADAANSSPVWRQSSPGLLLPCLDFDGSNDVFIFTNDAGSVPKALSAFITNSAFCLMIAIRVESVATNDASDPSNNEAIFCDSNFKWGLSLRNDSGQVKLQGWNNDGGFDFAEINISVDTNYVVMYRHDSGNLYVSVNGGSETSVASGNTSSIVGSVYLGENRPFAANYNGRIGIFKIWDTANADGNQATELASMIAAWVTAGSYTLTAAQVSFSLSGQTAALTASRKLTAAQASFVLSGQAAGLNRQYYLSQAQGSFTLTGNATSLLASRTLTSAQGSFALTGQVASLNRQFYLANAQGSFVVTGNAVALTASRGLTAAQASFTLTGQAATLTPSSRYLGASAGSFSLSGQTAALTASRVLSLSNGSFTLTGQDVTFSTGKIFSAAAGTFTLAGQDATLRASRLLSHAHGSFTLTGQNAGLLLGRYLTAAAGTFTLSGQAAALLAARLLTMVHGVFVLTGQAVGLYASNQPAAATPAERIYRVRTEDRSFGIAHENRTLRVPPDDRTTNPNNP